ncbi:hypothetical protein BCT73_06545 [Vibrio breoganii]|uniref:lipopolysaccharide biosynthesis protein n=1 Tax=Vibrio breoganii TaxID=553239 RepID=UPI000C84B291|nr:polysaccharide biosynthesis C-terminal domain-containing protein [Vibrio breoganii]PML61244.1 hypothetical protein BCT73_06545 [Vibrio breoganii]
MKLDKNFFYSIIATISLPVSNIVAVLLVSRYLDKAIFGEYSLSMTIIQGIAFVLSSGVQESSRRYVNTLNNKEFNRKYGFLLSVSLTITFIVSVLIFSIFYNDLYDYITILQISMIAILLPLIRFSINLDNYYEKYLRFATNKVLFSLATIIVPVSVAIIINESTYTMILSLTLGLVFMFVGNKGGVAKYFNFNKNYFDKDIFKYAVIITFSSIASWLISFSDRILISKYLSTSELAIYIVNVQLSGTVSLLSMVISIYYFPTIYRKFELETKAQLKKIRNIKLVIFFLTIIGSLIYFIFGKAILQLVLSDYYNVQSFDVVYILLLSNVALIYVNLSSVILSIKNKMIFNTLAFFIGAAVNLVINILYIEQYGVIVAAISTLVAYVIISMLVSCFSSKYKHVTS